MNQTFNASGVKLGTGDVSLLDTTVGDGPFLGASFASSVGGGAESLRRLRQRVRASFIGAIREGAVQPALARAHKACSSSSAPRDLSQSPEGLRLRTRESVIAGIRSSSLKPALAGAREQSAARGQSAAQQEGKGSPERLRLHARESLASGIRDRSLQRTLEAAQQPSGSSGARDRCRSRSDGLRQHARESVATGVRERSLQPALAGAQQRQSTGGSPEAGARRDSEPGAGSGRRGRSPPRGRAEAAAQPAPAPEAAAGNYRVALDQAADQLKQLFSVLQDALSKTPAGSPRECSTWKRFEPEADSREPSPPPVFKAARSPAPPPPAARPGAGREAASPASVMKSVAGPGPRGAERGAGQYLRLHARQTVATGVRERSLQPALAALSPWQASPITPLPLFPAHPQIVAIAGMSSVQANVALMVLIVVGALALDDVAPTGITLRGVQQAASAAQPQTQQHHMEPPTKGTPSITPTALGSPGVEPAVQPFRAEQPTRGSLRGERAEVTVADVEKSLLTELAANTSSERLRELEAALQPMYAALPKEESGYLGHQAVRYALHRLLLQRHGWFVVGLEPTDEALPPYLHTEWVPQYLQGLLEQHLGDRGLDLSETAALAATLEDLVRAEASRRMAAVFRLLRIPAGARLAGSEADRALETYMMMYLDGGNFTDLSKDMDIELATFKKEYAEWESAASWLQQLKEDHLSSTSDSRLGQAEMVSIANRLGERFGTFNDGECHSLKRELMGLEGPRPGRVPLLDFYKKGLYSHWEFNEKADYLRVLGALDESDELHPSVIISNYVGSRPNCLAASSLYAVCCRNECEDLMGHLERKIAASVATPQQILTLVSDLSSDTIAASRKLSDNLVSRLEQIAERHSGKVPLHGRLFAQWMHHAYPHECPYPHEGGVNPQTPDEWLQGEGQEQEARASEAEVRKLIGECANSGADGAPCRAHASAAAELPWSDAEVLLARGPSGTAGPVPWEVLAKAVLFVVLLTVMNLHKSGYFHDGSRSKKRMARNLDFADFDDFDGDFEKPGKGARRWQQWMVVLALVSVCTILEAMGWLDRFSFCIMLSFGLLLNVALPMMIHRTSKPTKCV